LQDLFQSIGMLRNGPARAGSGADAPAL